MNDQWSVVAVGGGALVVVGAFLVKVAPAVAELLKARAERLRLDAAAVFAEHARIEGAMQQTIDHLRQQLTAERDRYDARLDALEKEVRDCDARSARLQQMIEDLKGK